jgi:hypothetical protein
VVVVVIIVVQVALDLYAAQTVKAGHSVGFVAGLLMGAIVLMLSRSRSAFPEPNKSIQPAGEDARG